MLQLVALRTIRKWNAAWSVSHKMIHFLAAAEIFAGALIYLLALCLIIRAHPIQPGARCRFSEIEIVDCPAVITHTLDKSIPMRSGLTPHTAASLISRRYSLLPYCYSALESIVKGPQRPSKNQFLCNNPTNASHHNHSERQGIVLVDRWACAIAEQGIVRCVLNHWNAPPLASSSHFYCS